MRAITWLLLSSLWLLLAAAGARASDAAVMEYKVKAVYLFKFGRFVEWPAAAFASDRAPFVIGVLGGDEAMRVIQTSLVGKFIEARPVDLVAVGTTAVWAGYHILFVTRASGTTAESVRALLGAAPTLVVGEREGFGESGLKVSAKLASVAKLVKPRRGS